MRVRTSFVKSVHSGAGRLDADFGVTCGKMPHIFDNMVIFRPISRNLKLLKMLDKPCVISRKDVVEFRSERLSDGRETGMCEWWCWQPSVHTIFTLAEIRLSALNGDNLYV